MATRNRLALVQSYGRAAFAAIRFVPGATPVIQERWGIKSLTRNGAGDYTVALLGKPKGFVADPSCTENDTTHYHFVRVESQSDTAGTVTISHKSVAFASVGSGPALSDTVDAITVLFYCREE